MDQDSPIEILNKIEPGDENNGFQEMINFIKAVKDIDIDVVTKMFEGFDSSKFDQSDKYWYHGMWETQFAKSVWIVCALIMKTPKLFPIIVSNVLKFCEITIIQRSESSFSRIYYFRVKYNNGSIDESKFFINETNKDEKLFLESGFIKEKHWFFWDKFTFRSLNYYQ